MQSQPLRFSPEFTLTGYFVETVTYVIFILLYLYFVLSQPWLGNKVHLIIDATVTDDTEGVWEHFSQPSQWAISTFLFLTSSHTSFNCDMSAAKKDLLHRTHKHVWRTKQKEVYCSSKATNSPCVICLGVSKLKHKINQRTNNGGEVLSFWRRSVSKSISRPYLLSLSLQYVLWLHLGCLLPPQVSVITHMTILLHSRS